MRSCLVLWVVQRDWEAESTSLKVRRLQTGQIDHAGVFIEMFLTAQLVFVILMLAVEKQKSTFLAPVAIGLTVIVDQLVGIYYTGSSLNPARSFGPDVIVGFPHYHWIYCIFCLRI